MSRGSIVSRTNKAGKHVSWIVKFDGPRDPADKTKRVQIYETVKGRKSRAQQILTQRLREIDQGEFVAADGMTLKAWCDHWLEHIAPRKAKAARTIARYKELLNQYVLPRVGATVLQRLDGSAIDKLYSDLQKGGGHKGRPISAATVHRAHQVLNAALRAAAKARKINRNPMEDATPPSPDKPQAEHFTPDELAAILAAVEGTPQAPFVLLALVTGCRRGELCGLKWSDLDLAAGTLSIARSVEKIGKTLSLRPPKTRGSARTLSIDTAETDMLRTLWREQAETGLRLGVRLTQDCFVFPAAPDRPTEPADPDLYTVRFVRLLRRLGLKRKGRSLHSLRHSAATYMLRGGLDVKAVATRLGHSNATITLTTYAHSMADSDKRAGAIMSAIAAPKK